MTYAQNLADSAQTLPAGIGGAGLMFRNRLINGAMQIWQRGTTGTSGYVTDRWQGVNTTTCNRSSDVPTGHQYSIEYGNTGATYPYVCQSIESVHCIDLVGQSITISFWAKNISGTATLYTEIVYANSVDNFTSPTIITNSLNSASPSSSWTYYTVTFTNLPASVANGLQLRIVRNIASAATTRITGVQLEVGSTATQFERRPFGLELALCQRYYEKSYELNTTPGSVTTYGAIRQRTVGTDFWYYVQYKVAKRASPSSAVVYSNRVSNASGYLYQVDGTGSPADRVTTTSSISETGFQLYCGTIGSAGALSEFQWAVSAEL